MPFNSIIGAGGEMVMTIVPGSRAFLRVIFRTPGEIFVCIHWIAYVFLFTQVSPFLGAIICSAGPPKGTNFPVSAISFTLAFRADLLSTFTEGFGPIPGS